MPSKRQLISQHVARMRREVRKAVIPDPSELPAKYEWRIVIPDTPGTCFNCIDIANTKSEVRAKIKSALGSVPKGTIIRKTGREPRKKFIHDRIKELYEQYQNQSAVTGEIAGGNSDDADVGEPVSRTA
ncbi:hypothetical protein SH661x_001802 [Planctomicrobium sp. SH661]|uniref:hypothetical protein n=1 Tax=Planctomicrobium sp. SH661 TaxID=3448124 RepID=UPI003F5B3E97